MSRSEEIREIPIDKLEIDPMNVRGDPKVDMALIDSIRADGALQNLIVRPLPGGRFGVVAGVRRLVAARVAGLKTLPCRVRELSDIEAMAVSIKENVHRRDIPPWKWPEIITDFYRRLEGSKERRVKKMAEMTGMGYGTIKDYLLLSELPKDFKVRLKKPEERSFSEKQELAKTSAPMSEENAPITEESEKKPRIEPPQVPVRVMTRLARDRDFKRLMKKNPPKAHEIATEAAEKGRERVGEVLRKLRERPRREEPKPEWPRPVTLTVKLPPHVVEGLERYRAEHEAESLEIAAQMVIVDYLQWKGFLEQP